MKTLTLIRHAKSSWSQPELADFDRPLNKRGKGDAPLMGRRLARRGIRPELFVTSPAKRALKTARLIANEIGYPGKRLVTDERIYAALAEDLLEVLQGLDDDLGEVWMVGHNPSLTDLANYLTGASIDNIPTCGVVRAAFDIRRWKQLAHGSGELALFDHPKRSEQ
jgi:phosphohistidine phosphatase